MGMSGSNYLVPIERLDSWWFDLESEGLICTVELILSSKEPNGCVYRKVRFARHDEEVIAESWPGPRDRDDVFVLHVDAPVKDRPTNPVSQYGLSIDIDVALKRLGVQCVP